MYVAITGIPLYSRKRPRSFEIPKVVPVRYFTAVAPRQQMYLGFTNSRVRSDTRGSWPPRRAGADDCREAGTG